MRITPPTVELLRPKTREEGIEQMRFIERMARISHRSEDRQTSDSWDRFIRTVVLQHGDWSVTEHSYATVQLRVNRGITHELVRHRLFSPTQESTRFVNYSKKEHEPEYIPSTVVKMNDLEEWIDDLIRADATYQKWLNRGYAPQIARDHLPNALAATITFSGNFRHWRHVLLMRTTVEAHPDLRRVMTPLLRSFQDVVPILFEDIQPEARQIENMQKPR
jgi:thymidylate synthase (FAD)